MFDSLFQTLGGYVGELVAVAIAIGGGWIVNKFRVAQLPAAYQLIAKEALSGAVEWVYRNHLKPLMDQVRGSGGEESGLEPKLSNEKQSELRYIARNRAEDLLVKQGYTRAKARQILGPPDVQDALIREIVDERKANAAASRVDG